MQYTLMHKNIAVLDMELDEVTSSIQRIDAVYRPEHLPVATASKRDGVDRAALNAWWIDRCIPAAAPVCERRWKHWSCQIRRCC